MIAIIDLLQEKTIFVYYVLSKNSIMRKQTFQSILLFALVIIGFNACGQDNVITANELKQTSKEYLQNHFRDIEISRVVLEEDKDYSVLLADGTEVEFFKDGSIEQVEREGSALPSSIIPTKISEYISQNYPKQYIEKFKVERNHYEIELNNDLDLIFSKDGSFKRIDK